MKIKFYQAGFCTHPDFVVTGKFSFKLREFPMICALIQHPTKGNILFDVGYNHNFFTATSSFPYLLYRCITPVQIHQTLKQLLEQDGIAAEKIEYIILSHFHADHISAIDDFPNAQIICSRQGYEYAIKKGITGLIKGILPALMQMVAARKFIFLEDQPNTAKIKNTNLGGIDLWSDESMIACELPGHARGQYGLFCQATNLGELFLVADAVWTQGALKKEHKPHWITRLVNDDQRQYWKTVQMLQDFHQQYPEVSMIPSHCTHGIRCEGRDE